MLCGYMESEGLTNARFIPATVVFLGGVFWRHCPTRDPGIYRRPDENSKRWPCFEETTEYLKPRSRSMR